VPRPATADLEALIRALVAAGVEFLVVGGAAAVIHGAPVTTQDLDVVPKLDEAGLDRLLAALTSLDARFRPVRPDRDIPPTREHFSAKGQLNLITKFGPLDVLCRLHDARGYDELLPHSQLIEDADLKVRVIDLETLIEIKSSTGRARDVMVLPVLRALLDRGSSDE
jgi:hypothetical protein